jgi:hypothetical protein
MSGHLMVKVAVCLFLLSVVIGARVSASPITYQWEGDSGVTGFFTLDTAAFTTIDTEVDVLQTELTAFSFSGPGFMFDFADVAPGAAIVFDTTVTPPAFFDGAGGDAARDAAGNRLDFFGSAFGSGVGYFPVAGDGIFSSGRFVVTPEPTYRPLLLAGLLAVFLVKVQRTKFTRPSR